MHIWMNHENEGFGVSDKHNHMYDSSPSTSGSAQLAVKLVIDCLGGPVIRSSGRLRLSQHKKPDVPHRPSR